MNGRFDTTGQIQQRKYMLKDKRKQVQINWIKQTVITNGTTSPQLKDSIHNDDNFSKIAKSHHYCPSKVILELSSYNCKPNHNFESTSESDCA